MRSLWLNALLLASLAAPALAQPSRTISYHGVLADDSGVPVADGPYAVQITLYDAPTSGRTLYREDHTVRTQNGLFSLSIGAGTPTLGSFSIVSFADPVWMRVAVEGSSVGLRTRLEAVPVAHTLVPGAEVVGSVTSRRYAAIYGSNTASTGASYGVRGESASTTGRGVYGEATATSGSAYGVHGRSDSPSGRGVYGENMATSGAAAGVYGSTNSTTGQGVRGVAIATSGEVFGVFGTSQSSEGRGVHGVNTATMGAAYGVSARSMSTQGQAVFGEAFASDGETYGVYGTSRSSQGRGVRGIATSLSGTTYGGTFENRSPSGAGLTAVATARTGTTYGGTFENHSTSGGAIQAVSEATSGTTFTGFFINRSTSGRGLFADAQADTGTTTGVYGQSRSTSGRGVYGRATASSGLTYGVYGTVNSSTGYAGYFTGGRGLHVTASPLASDIVQVYQASNLRFRVTGAGNVRADGTFTGGGADLAEYFPLAPSAAVRPGQVVGVTGGQVSLTTDGAEQVAVVSSDPAFVGNPDAEAGGALVALVGQVEVEVTGPASVGDALVASGAGDGTARAVSLADYDPASDGPVLGRVLSVTEAGGVVALVGVDEAAALRGVVAELQADRDRQAARVEDLEARLARVEALFGGASAGSAGGR